MNNRIDKYQKKLFNVLFTALPSVRKSKDFCCELDIDVDVNYFYYFKNKDFWFTRAENEKKFLFLFGLINKPIEDISGKDTCLIIDFDKNNQFNNNSLGLFSIVNSEINILINNKILKEKYPYINNTDFKISYFKSIDTSLNLEVLDLGSLYDDFVNNVEKLIKRCSKIKSNKKYDLKNIEKNSDVCKICSKNITNFKINPNLNNLQKLKPDLCANCIEKIFVSEFYFKILPLVRGHDRKCLEIAKENFDNDQLFDIGLELLEKYEILTFIGVKRLFYSIDKNSYLANKFIKYSDKNKLLIDNFNPINVDKSKNNSNEDDMIDSSDFKEQSTEQMDIVISTINEGKSIKEAAELANVSPDKIIHWYNEGKIGNKSENVKNYKKLNEIENQNNEDNNESKNKLNQMSNVLNDDSVVSQANTLSIPKLIKLDSFENKNTIEQMNTILEDLSNGLTEDEAIAHANVSKKTYNYWLNRGKQKFGKLYIEFYNFINQINHEICDDDKLWEDAIDDNQIDQNIYAQLPLEYEKSFSHTSMNQSGIAWVTQIGKKWFYNKTVNGNSIRFSDENIYGLYRKVKKNNQVWGIRDYNKAKKIIDFPDDFEFPSSVVIEDVVDEVPSEIDPDIYAPLSKEYEKKFNVTQNNRTGIAWVNHVGKKWVYQRNINKQKIYIAHENIYQLHSIVKQKNLEWGIKEYNKARKIINIPKDFTIPESPETQIELNQDIFAPLPNEYLNSFNPNQKNKTGIAWVNQMGKKWVYQRNVNGLKIKFSDSDIHKLHEVVIKNNHVWGIIDFDKAKPLIESNVIMEDEESNLSNLTINGNVVVNYIQESDDKLDVLIKGTIKNTDLITVLTGLKLFENNIKRIITTSINNDVDLFIELEINKHLKKVLGEKVREFGWIINN